MARVAVTGGAGFVGAALTQRLLVEGHEVDVVDNLSAGGVANLSSARREADGRLKIHQFDVRDEGVVAQLARREPEVVIHLVAATDGPQSLQHPADDASVNVLGSMRVLEGALAAGSRKLVHVVAASACYDPAGTEPRLEDDVRRPGTPSGLSRSRFRDVVGLYADRLAFTELVVGNVYGPGQAPGRHGAVVATAIEALRRGEPAPVHGTGKQVRDFVYIDDTVDALVRAVERADGAVCNVGTGVGTSINDLVRAVAGALDVRPLAVAGPARPASADHLVLDVARAAVRLGWRPWTTLDDGVRATVAALGDGLSDPGGRS